MARSTIPFFLVAGLVVLVSSTTASSPAAIQIEDAIGMTRIQQTYGRGEDFVLSPDGRSLACVVWKGDLASNRNIHSLLLFDLRRQPAAHTVLLSEAYEADADDQHATPISGLRFLSDRTIAFVGSLNGGRAQVFTVDTQTKDLRVIASHPTDIRSFAASSNSTVLAFSATSAPDEGLQKEMEQVGFSLFDQRVPSPFEEGFGDLTAPTPEYSWPLQSMTAFARIAYGGWFKPTREYFVSEGPSSSRRLLAQSARSMAETLEETFLRSRPDITLSPTGSHAIIAPFTRPEERVWSRYRFFRDYPNPYVRAMVTSFGLVDLRAGKAEPLLHAPAEFYTIARPLWAPDGRSVIVRSTLPASQVAAFDSDPQLLEVEIATRRVRPIPGGSGWEPVLWTQQPETLTLRNGASVGQSVKRDGEWQPISVVASRADTGFNPRYTVGTNGAVVVGVKDSLTTAPEVALYDIQSKRTMVLTDLNPDLRGRKYATVEKIFWPGPADDTAFGYLVKPLDFESGKRYPVIILLKDTAGSDSSDDSFIIDGQSQLNGWAIQTFAARGLLVLLMPPPPSHRQTALTAREGERIVSHVERAVGNLARNGLIDARKVGLSGWSRAAYWVDYILSHSTFAFAAATDIDSAGGYKDFQQRWGASAAERDRDGRFQLDVRSVRTPLLSEQYGPASLVGQGEFITALHALGKPVEIYYYQDAPHSLKRPLHRLHSLERHLDWFRFWLQDYEDPDRRKQHQYDRWRRLRTLHGSPTVEGR